MGEYLEELLKKTNKHLFIFGKDNKLSDDNGNILFKGANGLVQQTELKHRANNTEIIKELVFPFDAHYDPSVEKYHKLLVYKMNKDQMNATIASYNKLGFFLEFFVGLGFDPVYAKDIEKDIEDNIMNPDCFRYAREQVDSFKKHFNPNKKQKRAFITVKNCEYFFPGLLPQQIEDISYCINEIAGGEYPLKICFASNKSLGSKSWKKMLKFDRKGYERDEASGISDPCLLQKRNFKIYGKIPRTGLELMDSKEIDYIKH